MRRLVLAVVLAVAALLLPSGEPAVAQPTTLPAPDFDNDGFGDLAVGVPGEDAGTAANAGAVQVLYGAADGLAADGRILAQGAGGVPGASEAGDRFGAALVTGRFNSDGYEDLAVGAPGEGVGADDGPARSCSCSARPTGSAAAVAGCSPWTTPSRATASGHRWPPASSPTPGSSSSAPPGRTSAASPTPARSA